MNFKEGRLIIKGEEFELHGINEDVEFLPGGVGGYKDIVIKDCRECTFSGTWELPETMSYESMMGMQRIFYLMRYYKQRKMHRKGRINKKYAKRYGYVRKR